MSAHLFVDLSHWQGDGGMSLAKWRQLRDCGVKAAIVKITQGTGHVDNAAERNAARARKMGMELGLYHFLDGSDPERQADHFLRTAKRVNAGKDARGRDRAGTLRDLLLVVDVERNPGSGGSPRGWHVRRFLRRLKAKAPRNTRLVYSSEGYWRAIGNPDMRDEADGLWQARWDRTRWCRSPRPDRPPRAGFGGWNGRPRFWQFGRLRVEGWGLDGNLFYGSLERLRDLFRTTNPAKPEPDPPPPPEPVSWRDEYNAMVSRLHQAVLGVADNGNAESEAKSDALAVLEALYIAADDGEEETE